MLSSFHRFLYLFKRTLHSCKSFWKKKCCTPLYKGTVQNDPALCNECNLWNILLRRAYIGGFGFEKHFTVHAESWIFLGCSCVVFLPMVWSKFLGDEPICTWYVENFANLASFLDSRSKVYLPLWKIWVRQLGWWNFQYMESIMESHKSHVPVTTKQWPCLFWLCLE